MAEASLIKLYATNFIDYEELFIDGDKSKEVKTPWRDLIQSFFRNRVYLEFSIDDISAPNLAGYFDNITDEMRRFCDKNGTGLWTADVNTIEETVQGSATRLDEKQVVGANMILMFEHRQDRDMFVKDCGLILRLSN